MASLQNLILIRKIFANFYKNLLVVITFFLTHCSFFNLFSVTYMALCSALAYEKILLTKGMRSIEYILEEHCYTDLLDEKYEFICFYKVSLI